MKKKEVREYLFRIYRKTISSFLANTYKASITANSKDIHRTRLDVKKLYALFSLFEALDHSDTDYKHWYRYFRPLYRQAGKIREIQVNYMLLAHSETWESDLGSFLQWLKEREQRAAKKFIVAVKKINEQELTLIGKAVGKLCDGNSISNLRSRTEHYLVRNAIRVDKLQSENPGVDEIHLIRMHLKAMSTVLTLVYSFNPVRHYDQIVTALNKTEMMIGDWHDKVVLEEAVKAFMVENQEVPEEERKLLTDLKEELSDNCQNLVNHFMPEVSVIVRAVMAIENENGAD